MEPLMVHFAIISLVPPIYTKLVEICTPSGAFTCIIFLFRILLTNFAVSGRNLDFCIYCYFCPITDKQYK